MAGKDCILIDDILELGDRSPVLQASRLVTKPGPNVFLKMESLLPGSVSSFRAIRYLIQTGIKEGTITNETTVILPSDGPAGYAAAIISAVIKIKLTAVLPEDTNPVYVRAIEALGSEVVKTPSNERVRGAIAKANELVAESRGTRLLINLYESSQAVEYHKKYTANEIIKVLGKDVDAIIGGVNSGSTLSGCALQLKINNPNIKVYAVEPAESNVLTGGKAHSHSMPGIGAGFVPASLDQSMITKVIAVSKEEALEGAKLLARKEGVLVGAEGGAVISALLKVVSEFSSDQDILVILNGSPCSALDGSFY